MKPAGIAPVVLPMASVASAHPMVPIKDVSSHTGKWKGFGGPGASGSTPTVVVRQTNDPDGT